MTPPEKAGRIKTLHAAYVARTGYEIALNAMRERQWWDWCEFGGWQWSEADLARVIGYLRGQIRINKRNEGALKFGNLIGHPDTFEEDLQLAKEASKGNPMFQAKPKAQAPAGSAGLASDGKPLDVGAQASRRFLEMIKSDDSEPQTHPTP